MIRNPSKRNNVSRVPKKTETQRPRRQAKITISYIRQQAISFRDVTEEISREALALKTLPPEKLIPALEELWGKVIPNLKSAQELRDSIQRFIEAEERRGRTDFKDMSGSSLAKINSSITILSSIESELKSVLNKP